MGDDHQRQELRRRASARGVALALAAVLAALLLGACSGSGASGDPTVLRAGQMNIKLPDGFKVVDGKVERPASAADSASDGAAGDATGADAQATETTIVATKEDPTTALFTAFSKFRKCLEDTGTKFIGAPDASNPDSPTNDPTYLKNLGTCAAKSNIQAALAASQSANENLTPAEIKERNKGYLRWRSCMVDRGWKVPEPVPDAQGRLFNFGGGGSGSQIEGPPGKDLLTSKDLEQCAAKAQKAAGG
jgi:hypothetical protein